MDVFDVLDYFRCPRCGFDRLEHVDDKVVRCQRCESSYELIDYRLIDFIGDPSVGWVGVFERYPRIYNYWSSFGWFLFTFKKYSYLVDKLVYGISNGAVADIGTGTGIVIESLERNIGFDNVIFGVDISLSMLKYALKKTRKAIYVRAYMENLPFRNNVLDYYISNMTIHISNNIDKVLKEASRVIKDKSELRFTTITGETLRGKIFSRLFHVNSLSCRDYTYKLKSINIDIESCEKIGFAHLIKALKT